MNRTASERPTLLSIFGPIALSVVVASFGLSLLPEDRRRGRRPARLGRDEGGHVAATRRHDGRGRRVDTPSKIPAAGWKDIGLRTFREIQNDRLLAVAAGVTFYALLAIFPAIVAIVSLYGLFADIATISDHLAVLSGFLPGGAIEIVGEQVKRIASGGDTTLGFAFFIGLGVSLWSANAGVKALFDALNVVYEEEEKRSFIKLNAISLTFTLGAILFLLCAIGAIVVLPVAFKFVGIQRSTEWILAIARWPALLVVILFGLAVLYRFAPSRERARWRWVTWGSALAAIVWAVGSMLFSWYVSNFGNYNETYGSLGAAIGFMTWIWLSTAIILVGGEINAEMEHQTARDTTDGRRMPMGARGARMADEAA